MVRYPNGFEQIGLAIADDVVEVDAIGLYVELRDIILIDGVPRRVLGVHQDFRSPTSLGRPESEGAEHHTRLRHGPVPEDQAKSG